MLPSVLTKVYLSATVNQAELINFYAFEVNLKSDYFDWPSRQRNRGVTYSRKHLASTVAVMVANPLKLEYRKNEKKIFRYIFCSL